MIELARDRVSSVLGRGLGRCKNGRGLGYANAETNLDLERKKQSRIAMKVHGLTSRNSNMAQGTVSQRNCATA